MSRLIFEGDTISRFGKKIPTPFIDKIKIYDQNTEVEVSIYLHITEDDATNQQIYDDLSNLYFHSGFMSIRLIPEQLRLGETFVLVSDQIYNSQGKRFAKFTYNSEQEYGTIIGTSISRLDRALTRTSKRDTYYSCFISVAQDENENLNSSLTTENDPSGEIGEIDERGVYARYSNISSPLVYEKVFTAPLNGVGDNRLAIDPIIIYEDARGLPCESVPLYSIQKNYYKTTDSFREQLKKQIDDLVASYGTANDQQLQSFLDSISFIAQTKNKDVDFITELDKVRNSFPSRTSTSSLGTLYNRLKDILFSANDALVLGTQLRKRIVPNTKLISYFGLETQDRLGSWQQRTDETLYSPRPDDTGQFLYGLLYMERQELEVDKFSTRTGTLYDVGVIQEPNYDVVRNFGYFFFDYEKALHKKSNISQIYEVQKLLNLFGNTSLDGQFEIKNSLLKRFDFRDDTLQTIFSEYEDNLTSKSLRRGGNTRGSVEQVVFKPSTDVDTDGDSAPGIVEKNYVVLRKFDTAVGLGDYRLLAFEFQDFQPSTQALETNQKYTFRIQIRDNTMGIYDVLKAKFSESIELLQRYLEFAEEFCSYNNIDERFNDFFIDGIRQEFSTIPSGFPWDIAPRFYAIHLDLVEDAFGGNLDSMKTYSDFFSKNYLSPENTTLPVLRDKIESIVSFYEKYYGDDGIITRLVDNLPDPTTGIPSSTDLRDNTELVFTKNYGAFPDVVDFTPDPEQPVAMKLWNGNTIDYIPNNAKEFIASRALALLFARIFEDAPNNYYSIPPEVMAYAIKVRFFEYTYTDAQGAIQIASQNISRKEKRRANRMFSFILVLIERVISDSYKGMTYSQKKEMVNEKITNLKDKTKKKEEVVKKWKKNDRDFVAENRAVFGNIALYAIKAYQTRTFSAKYDVLMELLENADLVDKTTTKIAGQNKTTGTGKSTPK
jgi:hypothetical protein